LDQRRFISFLLLSVGVMMLFSVLFPPPKPADKPAPAAGAQADGEQKDAEVKDKAKDDDAGKVAEKAPAAAAHPIPEVAESSVPTQFATLGSLDPTSGYRMLVTLTNAGAAVHRAEMTKDRYRDQHDWSGYLGELELIDVQGGTQVQVVGAGTPAANAKPAPIEAGDVIVGVGEAQTSPVKSADDLRTILAKTRPGDQITLQVRHGENGPQPRIVQLAWRPLSVLRPEIDNYLMRNVKPPADFVDRPSLLLSVASLNGKSLDKDDSKRLTTLLEEGKWELTAHDANSATFRRALPELNLELIKRYKLEAAPAESRNDSDYPAYHLQLEVELHNTGQAPQSVAYRLDGPTGMPLEGWWYAHKISQHWSAAGLRDVAVRFAGSPELQIESPLIAAGKVEPMGDGQALAYAGVDGQYFSAVLIPQIQSLEDAWFDSTEAIAVGPIPELSILRPFTNVTCRLTRKTISLDAGAVKRDAYRVFIGPKRPDLLREYYAANDPNYSLKDLIYFGWFGAIARAMLVVLHFFYSIVGNYGIAIVMLTVLVRGAMFPISYKQTQNMARMQALKPEMDRITDKYKNDMPRRSQAIQELYKKHNINPLGGCLPVFLQMPIFIGLYRSLMVDVELRQSPLFGHAIRWCSNLAAPDMFLNWSRIMPEFVSNGMGLPGLPLGTLLGLGPYLNILPLVTVSLFLVTQKMSMPAPTNEQAAMQQKMMKYMTVFMGLMFYKVASGLCLYFIASSLWGIAERKLLPKAQVGGNAAAGGASGSGPGFDGKRPRGDGPTPGSNGNGGPRKSRKVKRKK
jgi:YidC/Oxa1 family membrane protein insertase